LLSVTAPQPQSPQARAVAVSHAPEESLQLVKDVCKCEAERDLLVTDGIWHSAWGRGRSGNKQKQI